MLRSLSFLLTALALATSACSSSSKPTPPAANSAAAGAYVLAAEPAGARGVIDVRKDSPHNADVVIVGRVGGDAYPFVEGLAAFQIVDPALKPCTEEEGCPTPWDYCCTEDLAAGKAMVEIVDAQGEPLSGDARTLLGIKELSTVVVKGQAQRDDAGNLTVRASGIFVRR